MRLTATVCVALVASLCLTFEHASAQSCEDVGNKLLSNFADAKTALATKGCSALDPFVSALTLYADFLDSASGNGCSKEYVALSRILVSETYKKPPADCGDAWKTKGDNRRLQYDAIAALNGDIGRDVFIDGDAVVLKQEFWHEGNHTVALGIRKCRRKDADAAFALQCAEGKATSESIGYTFDAALIDPQRIDVTETSALIVLFGRGIRTPEEFARAQARTDGVSGATSIVLHCLPDTQCVHTVGGGVKMNLLQLYCDPETNCNDVLSHIVDVLAMMKRAPH
jgi:hypothetical protein